MKRIIEVMMSVLVAFFVNHPPVMGQFGSAAQYFPQVVLNQGSTTSFTVHNPSAVETISVEVLIQSSEGNELVSRQVDLGPGATETVSFGDSNMPLMRGSAELSSEHEFIATEFFQLFLGSLKPRVGVLPSPPSEEIRFLGFVDQGVRSGLAVHNPSPDQAANITLRLRDSAGQQPIDDRTLDLQPGESVAAYLNDEVFFGPALSSFEGAVEISASPSQVAALSLIQEASGDLATVAVEVASHIRTGTSNTAIGRDAALGLLPTIFGSYSGVQRFPVNKPRYSL